MKKIVLFLFLIINFSISIAKTESQISQSHLTYFHNADYRQNMRRLARVEKKICDEGWIKHGRYKIYIVYNLEPNAIAYPNSLILINSGLMDSIKSDEELELILWLLIVEPYC